MIFNELVKKRRSVRKYLNKKIPREIIDQCLEAARLAPSACNVQPWSFIVIDNPELKNKIADQAFSGLYSLNSFVKQAPVLIVVITDKVSFKTGLGKLFRKVQYSLIDIGIACDHLTLQAEELGVGSCWLGWFNEKVVKKILNLPKSDSVDILISLGYPEKDYIKEKKRKSLDEIRRYI